MERVSTRPECSETSWSIVPKPEWDASTSPSLLNPLYTFCRVTSASRTYPFILMRANIFLKNTTWNQASTRTQLDFPSYGLNKPRLLHTVQLTGYWTLKDLWMSVLLFAETEMESLTSSITVLIYQMVNKEMPREIRKVRSESVLSRSEMSRLCSMITVCLKWELRRKDHL